MTDDNRQRIMLGGGCFWCVEAVFEQLRGVEQVVSGYAGGHVRNPSYREVCGKKTGHAEVVQVTYDPREITLRDILEVFLTTHNPTTPNQQGADVGPQYRSIILYHTPEQKQVAEETIADFNAQGIWGAPIVTEVKPLDAFYPAEEEHKAFYQRNPNQPYCQAVISPKLNKLRSQHMDKLRD